MRRRFLAGAGAVLALGLTVVASQVGRRAPAVTASVGKKGCDIVITAPATDWTHVTTLRSGEALSVAFSGTARRCPSSTVSLFKKEGGGGETSLGTTTTNTSGAWSYTLTPTGGVVTTFIARMTAGTVTTEVRATVDANTSLPKLVVTAPSADTGSVLRIVAPKGDAGCGSGGNVHVDEGEVGWLSDEACADGGQVTPSVTVTGASGGNLFVLYGGVVLVDAGVTSSPQTLGLAELGQLTLPEFSRADLTFRAKNASGVTEKTYATRVMTVAPPNLLGPDGGEPAVTLLNKRSATVAVDYVLPTVPAGVAGAHVEAAWTHQVPLHTSFTGVTRPPVQVGTTPVEVGSLDAGLRGQVIFKPCTQDGGAAIVIWCDTTPTVAPDAGLRIVTYQQTDGGACSSNFTSNLTAYRIFTATADGGSAMDTGAVGNDQCEGLAHQTKPLYCVAESDFINLTPIDADICVDYRQFGWKGNPYLLHYPSSSPTNESGVARDCQLIDETSTPQTWDCQGTILHSGDIRRMVMRLGVPMTTYFVHTRVFY